MKIEHIECDNCGGDVNLVKEGGFRKWFCEKCNKIVIGKSILVGGNDEPKTD